VCLILGVEIDSQGSDMTHKRELPHLLALLDDDSTVVQKEVRNALTNYGDLLRKDTTRYLSILNEQQKGVLDQICRELEASALAESWLGWITQGDSIASMEMALMCLSGLMSGDVARETGSWLDQLADGFATQYPQGTVAQLMEFIFQEQQFKCIAEEGCKPEHDYVSYALREREGSTVALTSIIVLVGWRVGLNLRPVFVYGKLIPMSCQGHTVSFYNLHFGGQVLKRSSAIFVEEAIRRNCTWPSELSAKVFEIAIHILQRTIQFYYEQNDRKSARWYSERYREMVQALENLGIIAAQ